MTEEKLRVTVGDYLGKAEVVTYTILAASLFITALALRDAATNAFREFWPDIATHVLHRYQ